ADVNSRLADAVKRVAEAKREFVNARFDPFRFTLSEARDGTRGSGRARTNARLIQANEQRVQQVLDRNNLEFDESGNLQYVPAPGESAESIASRQAIAQSQILPRLRALMGSAAALRRGTANLARSEQDQTKAQREAMRAALDESKNLAEIRKALQGKF